MNIRFSKNGFWHPAFGRMGRGANQGRIYSLPDWMKDYVPKSAQIIRGEDALADALDAEEQSRPTRPAIVDEKQLEMAKKRAEAVKKTTRRKPAPAPATEPADSLEQ